MQRLLQYKATSISLTPNHGRDIMTQEMTEEKFLASYGNLLIQTWGDEDLKQRFKSNTVEVLKEFGMDPGTAMVVVKAPHEEEGPECTPESQIQLWNEGLKTGTIDFIYPEGLPEGAEGLELSAAQLEAISGGTDGCCCCCTPCCSCSC